MWKKQRKLIYVRNTKITTFRKYVVFKSKIRVILSLITSSVKTSIYQRKCESLIERIKEKILYQILAKYQEGLEKKYFYEKEQGIVSTKSCFLL